MPEQILCKAALTDFATTIWRYGMDELMFPSTLRQRQACVAV